MIGNDQYFKRDDVGIIYQLNVLPTRQRGLIGATLLKAMFDRAAYGCRLFCCWCAKDIEANRFWESMRFVPLAFRAGSEVKRRVHIFWQRRIRAGDEITPWWFPSETKGGAMMEDRLVFPIPPGTHWSDAKPIVLPKDTVARQLPGAGAERAKAAKARAQPPVVAKRQPLGGALMFQGAVVEETKEEKPNKRPRQKANNDPKFVSAARELRDRWLEAINSERALPAAQGKYDVARQLQAEAPAAAAARNLLQAA